MFVDPTGLEGEDYDVKQASEDSSSDEVPDWILNPPKEKKRETATLEGTVPGFLPGTTEEASVSLIMDLTREEWDTMYAELDSEARDIGWSSYQDLVAKVRLNKAEFGEVFNAVQSMFQTAELCQQRTQQRHEQQRKRHTWFLVGAFVASIVVGTVTCGLGFSLMGGAAAVSTGTAIVLEGASAVLAGLTYRSVMAYGGYYTPTLGKEVLNVTFDFGIGGLFGGAVKLFKHTYEPIRYTVNYFDEGVEILSPYAKGQIGVNSAISSFEQKGGRILHNEVTINFNGTRIRADSVGLLNGNFYVIEAKNGLGAAFTKNQGIVYPTLPARGLPVGGNAAATGVFEKGTSYPFKLFLHWLD